jgi:glycosyltransferase involved in cell wall biosynthesis
MRLGNAPTVDAFHRRVWRLIDTVVDRYVPNSAFIAGELEKHRIDRRKVDVVYNTTGGRFDRVTPPAPRDPTRVLYVGQIIPPKGVDLLLDAIALVAARGIDVTLQIVGRIDGWESPSYAGHLAMIRARAAEPDLAARVSFVGYDEDVTARFAQAAVHCCPSRPEQREGLAGVVLEAKSAGVPSVVTATGSLPELVRHRVDGWIADPSAESLADGLAYFLTDDAARREASAAARQSTATFSRERFERGWARVFGIEPSPAASPAPSVERRAS